SNVDGNHGNSNGLDLILFDGTLTNSLSWLTPTNMTSDHAFGYAILNGLTITSGNTLTLPAGAILKSFGTLTFQGATLDATAGGGTTIQHAGSFGISASSTRVSVTNTAIDGTGADGVNVSNSTNNVFSGLVVQNVASPGLRLTPAPSTVSRSRFTSVGATTVGNFAVIANNSDVSIAWSRRHGSVGAVFTTP